MTEKKWELVDSKNVFESKWLTIEDRAYVLPDGRKVEGYYHLNRPDYVLILAVDDQNRIVVERQYRRGVDDFVYELPAGWINEGETPIETAKRELKEEVGYDGVEEHVFEIYPQPGFSSMKAYVVLLKIQGEQMMEHRDDDEFLTHELMEFEKIREMIQAGKIKDMGFLSAIGLYNIGK